MAAMRPWDESGKLISGVTVRSWLEFLKSTEYSGTVTVDRAYYNFPSVLISRPDDLDMSAEIIALDDGYYGTPGVLTK